MTLEVTEGGFLVETDSAHSVVNGVDGRGGKTSDDFSWTCRRFPPCPHTFPLPPPPAFHPSPTPILSIFPSFLLLLPSLLHPSFQFYFPALFSIRPLLISPPPSSP